jgi:hypothetical protein
MFESKGTTDREKAGLRGTVKTCVEESVNPSAEFLISREYSPDGQLLAARLRQNGSEQVIANDVGEGSGFFQDEHGRKVAVKTFDPKTLQRGRAALAMGVSLWDAALTGHGVPVGGKVRTTYNQDDQPTELQILDGEGQVLSRVVRTYDADGRIIEEKPICENPGPLFLKRFPAEQIDQMTPENIKLMSEELKTLLAGQAPAGTFYTYDTQGRVTKICERNMAFERTVTTAYNEKGDRAEERITVTDNCVQPVPFTLPEPTEFRYEYEYDSYGNWIQQTANDLARPDVPSSVCQRKLTYY